MGDSLPVSPVSARVLDLSLSHTLSLCRGENRGPGGTDGSWAPAAEVCVWGGLLGRAGRATAAAQTPDLLLLALGQEQALIPLLLQRCDLLAQLLLLSLHPGQQLLSLLLQLALQLGPLCLQFPPRSLLRARTRLCDTPGGPRKSLAYFRSAKGPSTPQLRDRTVTGHIRFVDAQGGTAAWSGDKNAPWGGWSRPGRRELGQECSLEAWREEQAGTSEILHGDHGPDQASCGIEGYGDNRDSSQGDKDDLDCIF